MASTRRIPMVAGNWKMNFDHLEATEFVRAFSKNLKRCHFDFNRCEVALFPSFTSIRSVQVMVESEHLRIRYGAQAVSVTSQGAFTGDVSADMLAHLGCSYVIVGHSERRKYHPEDDANIVDQVRAVLAAGMQPILCVGESLEERRKGIELEFAVGQVHDVTRDLSDGEASKLIIAYEPRLGDWHGHGCYTADSAGRRPCLPRGSGEIIRRPCGADRACTVWRLGVFEELCGAD